MIHDLGGALYFPLSGIQISRESYGQLRGWKVAFVILQEQAKVDWLHVQYDRESSMRMLKKLLCNLAGNAFMQDILAKNVEISHYLMGIGSGSDVQASGESAIFNLIEPTQVPVVIFDVGANQGQFLRLVKQALRGKVHEVHCFEPGRETYRLLAQSANKFDNVIFNNLALGKEKGDVLLHYDNQGSGLASLTKRKLDHFNIEFSQSETVVIDTLDAYCSNAGVQHIDVLKIDVEGHELDVLSGARSMLSNKSIDIITFEFGGCNIDTRTYFQDFWYLLADAGYILYRITPSGYLYRLKTYKEMHEQFRTTNFIARLA